MPHATRALELLFQAIAEVDSSDELARLRATAVELYAGDDETLADLMRAMDTRGAALVARLEQAELFPIVVTEKPPEVDSSLGPAPADLVREWCDQVRTMGPDELNALEELTQGHWERTSLSELRGAIENRRRQLGV